MKPVTQDFGICRCNDVLCIEYGTKLKKTGHLTTCVCAECRGSRNYVRGHRDQQIMHERLGGTGTAPTNEDRARPYIIRVMPESKGGAQIPISFTEFLAGAFFRQAMQQADSAVPVGSGVIPSIVIDGRWLVADLDTTGRGSR